MGQDMEDARQAPVDSRGMEIAILLGLLAAISLYYFPKAFSVLLALNIIYLLYFFWSNRQASREFFKFMWPWGLLAIAATFLVDTFFVLIVLDIYILNRFFKTRDDLSIPQAFLILGFSALILFILTLFETILSEAGLQSGITFEQMMSQMLPWYGFIFQLLYGYLPIFVIVLACWAVIRRFKQELPWTPLVYGSLFTAFFFYPLLGIFFVFELARLL